MSQTFSVRNIGSQRAPEAPDIPPPKPEKFDISLTANVQWGTRQAGQWRRSSKFDPLEDQENHQLFNELYCYELQSTELKLLHDTL